MSMEHVGPGARSSFKVANQTPKREAAAAAADRRFTLYESLLHRPTRMHHSTAAAQAQPQRACVDGIEPIQLAGEPCGQAIPPREVLTPCAAQSQKSAAPAGAWPLQSAGAPCGLQGPATAGIAATLSCGSSGLGQRLCNSTNQHYSNHPKLAGNADRQTRTGQFTRPTHPR